MQQERLFFIDWLRFIAVIILIFFHTGLIFASQSNFHIKNNELSPLIEHFISFIHGWRLSLLFFISGVGTSIALGFRSKSTYIKERLQRLLIPLIFGILVIVPPQIYFERLSQGFGYDSFSSFYIESFSTGLYPYGNLSWHHLWFVAYLLIYSILSIPIFKLMNHRTAFWFDGLMYNGGIIFWGIPMAIIPAILKPHSSGVQNIVDDLAMFFFYWLVFCGGFAVNQKRYWSFFEGRIVPLLTGAILLTVIAGFLKASFSGIGKNEVWYSACNFLSVFASWLWLLFFIALGKEYLNVPGKFLPFLNESVYPVYILHQTVIISIGYFIVQQSWTISVKFFTISFMSIIICGVLFGLIRMNKVTRLVFGIRNKFSVKES